MSLHTPPFSGVGHDLHGLKDEIRRKADSSDLYPIRRDVDGLERTVGELRTANDELRTRCERLEEAVRELNPGLNI